MSRLEDALAGGTDEREGRRSFCGHTRSGCPESRGVLMRRIEEAAKHFPRDRLAVSPAWYGAAWAGAMRTHRCIPFPWRTLPR